MRTQPNSSLDSREKLIVLAVFLAVGSLIMAVFSPWQPMLSDRADYVGRLSLMAVLFRAAQYARTSSRFEKYWLVMFGLFTLSAAVSLDYIFGLHLYDRLGMTDRTPPEWALQKLNEFVVVVGTVLILHKLVGLELRSLYIQRGNLKLGLTIGLSTFLLAAAGSVPMAVLFKAQDLTVDRIVPWVPWILIFVLANAAMEEILFRGVFLQKLEPFAGKFLANFLVAIVFTLIHGAATYTVDTYLFLAVVFPLALAWGWVTQKTGAVWGSILFHAGMDIPILLGIFSNL